MKKILGILLALTMLSACGQKLPQEEIQTEETFVAEEQAVQEEPAEEAEAEIIDEETTEEVPAAPVDDAKENPATEPSPQIIHSQPSVEIIRQPCQKVEINPTVPYEEGKLNPNTDGSDESVTVGTFDVSCLDVFYDFSRAKYNPHQMIGEASVISSKRYLHTQNARAVSDVVGSMKLIFEDANIMEASDEQRNLYLSMDVTAPQFPVVQIIAADTIHMLHIFPQFSVMEFGVDNVIYLDTDETHYQAVIKLIDVYDESAYDESRDTLSGTKIIAFDDMELYYKAKLLTMTKAEKDSFKDEAASLLDGKGRLIPDKEQIAAYEGKQFIATMEYVGEGLPKRIHFAEDCVITESDTKDGERYLRFYYAGNIQDELHDLFEKYAN